jgi:hypothetical protein
MYVQLLMLLWSTWCHDTALRDSSLSQQLPAIGSCPAVEGCVPAAKQERSGAGRCTSSLTPVLLPQLPHPNLREPATEDAVFWLHAQLPLLLLVLQSEKAMLAKNNTSLSSSEVSQYQAGGYCALVSRLTPFSRQKVVPQQPSGWIPVVCVVRQFVFETWDCNTGCLIGLAQGKTCTLRRTESCRWGLCAVEGLSCRICDLRAGTGTCWGCQTPLT